MVAPWEHVRIRQKPVSARYALGRGEQCCAPPALRPQIARPSIRRRLVQARGAEPPRTTRRLQPSRPATRHFAHTRSRPARPGPARPSINTVRSKPHARACVSDRTLALCCAVSRGAPTSHRHRQLARTRHLHARTCLQHNHPQLVVHHRVFGPGREPAPPALRGFGRSALWSITAQSSRRRGV